MTKQLTEGMGSINVEEEIDVSRIRVLAGLANSTTVAGTPVVAESEGSEMTQEEADELADQLERLLIEMNNTLADMEHVVRQRLPGLYRSMEAYTFAHIKTSLGGHGYMDRMSTSISDLVEGLRDGEYSDGQEY
jgi:hypothetical protein